MTTSTACNFNSIKQPLTNDHLSTTTAIIVTIYLYVGKKLEFFFFSNQVDDAKTFASECGLLLLFLATAATSYRFCFFLLSTILKSPPVFFFTSFFLSWGFY
jgi:hypothetical protein